MAMDPMDQLQVQLQKQNGLLEKQNEILAKITGQLDAIINEDILASYGQIADLNAELSTVRLVLENKP